ncbi:hypothetical protein M153_444000426, partial [Pseudoloma neurophilia]
MGFSTRKPREFIDFLTNKNVQIHSSLNPMSVLATDILKTVFEVECINYEISFRENLENIEQNEHTNIFIDFLPRKDLDGIFIGIGAKKLYKRKLLRETRSLAKENKVTEIKENSNKNELKDCDGIENSEVIINKNEFKDRDD